jgi:hypothetical protein
MKYLICRNRKRITVKRSDRCYDFGDVIAEAATLSEANAIAKQNRQLQKILSKPTSTSRR